MVTQIGIVYATGSKLPRRIIVPDSDSELNDPVHLQAGEAMLRIARTLPHDLISVRGHIAKHLGVAVSAIPSGRCTLINQKNRMVEHAICADPAIDKHPTHSVVASDIAEIGWKYDGTKFLARYVTLDANNIVTSEQWQDASILPSAPAGVVLAQDAVTKIGAVSSVSARATKATAPIEAASSGTVQI